MADQSQFDLKITRGNTIVANEKLDFLQKAHAQRYAAAGGPSFQDMVDRVCRIVRESYSDGAMYVCPLILVFRPQSYG